MSGYRKLISDRIPATWDLALRWLKCRRRYIERIYNIGIARLNTDVTHTRKQNNDRKMKYVNDTFNLKKWTFKDTLELHRLNKEETLDEFNYWNKISDWVAWFAVNTPYIKDLIKSDRDKGEPEEVTINKLVEKYGIKETLANYLIEKL